MPRASLTFRNLTAERTNRKLAGGKRPAVAIVPECARWCFP